MAEFRVERSKLTLLISSIAFFWMLVLAAQEEENAEWKVFQTRYGDLLEEKAQAENEPAVEYPIEIRQVFLEELNRVDRCVTCHVGIDNPKFQGAAQPLAVHSGDMLKHHPSDKFGCTVCHQGQGRATLVADAHGHVPHWPEPMLKGKLVYTSCGQCHYENDLYGGQSDLFGVVTPISHIPQGELDAGLPGAENISQGKKLVVENGCLGCHKYRGRGGMLGPNITHIGNKTAHDFDFKHVEGEHTVKNWMFAHFKSPKAVVPKTTMPNMNLTDEDADSLALYMVSLKQKSAPAAYTPQPRETNPVPVRGETLYQMYCSACHGKDGVGAVVRDPNAIQRIDWPKELMTPSLRNIDTLGVTSDDYLHKIIAEGRKGTSMPSWKHGGGLTDDEIVLLIGFIRGWEPRAADRALVSASRGNVRYGAALFRANCRGCHGASGEGGQIGVSLRSPTFLSLASDEFLAETILHGRSNTAMPSWRQFDKREVSDLLAYLRSQQPLRSRRDEVLGSPVLAHAKPLSNSVAIGVKLYRSRCAVCHGENGMGNIGPSLHNQSFLSVVTNDYLHDTIVEGHPGTAMPAWRQLSSRDVVDIISLLRSWQTEPRKMFRNYQASGDWQNGAALYKGICASCHGPDAEGAIGPQLTNPVFQKTVTDTMLTEWISYGRTGTQMRPHLRGLQGNADLSPSQIEDIVTFLRHQRGRRRVYGQRIGLGFAPRGKILFKRMCVSCHGENGEGTTGPAIGNADFLNAVSDGFLRGTVVLGRDGTEMRSMGHGGAGIVELRAEEIDDLIAYLRNMPAQPRIAHRFVIGANAELGKVLYAGQCAGCHGVDGKGFQDKKGNFAPHLNNADFLRAATDGFLQATIIRGRRGTAMRAFGQGGHGLSELSQEQINNIIAYVRQWSPDTRPLQRTEVFSRNQLETEKTTDK